MKGPLFGPDPEKVMPLGRLPVEHQARIAALVARLDPPERFIYFGDPSFGRPLASMSSRAWWEWHWQRGVHPERRRPRLSERIRQQVIARDGFICGICQGVVPLHDVHIDHIFPVSRGGTDALINLRVTHSVCNLRKAATT